MGGIDERLHGFYRVLFCTKQFSIVIARMSIFIGMQALINIGVITAAFPTKGMPAPMISYGGSNLLTCLIATACVASVAIDSAIPDYPDKLLKCGKKRLHFNSHFAKQHS
jgi:cell division protein FtsW (lipid II flippase)